MASITGSHGWVLVWTILPVSSFYTLAIWFKMAMVRNHLDPNFECLLSLINIMWILLHMLGTMAYVPQSQV
jgi:hypothetical protein